MEGRYDDEVVALKIRRAPREDHHVQKTKSISMWHDPPVRVRGCSDRWRRDFTKKWC